MLKILYVFLLCASLQSNATEDKYNSFISINPNDSSPDQTSIAIKDNIDVKGMPTTAGSLALKKNFPAADAFIIKKLKLANFHIYGKTNLSEWANFRSFESVSGWSSVGGQTLNPHGINTNPCGSSSGSAVAVASGMVSVAIGTETNGSISCPASVNGIVGMKPSVGLVSRTGIVPISSSQDTAGPMANSVLNVARALQAMAGKDPADVATHQIPENYDFNFLKGLQLSTLKDKRFGLLESGSNDAEGLRLINKIKHIITENGGKIVLIKDERVYPSEKEFFILLYEFKRDLEAYLKQAVTEHKTLNAIINFNRNNARLVMPHFEQEIFIESSRVSDNTEAYVESIKVIETVQNEMDELLQAYDLDAFVGLTRNPAWKIDYNGGDNAAMVGQRNWGNGGFAAIAGYPHITLPLGSVDGLPVGVSFIASKWKEKQLLEFAAAFERANQ
jgi:Asp-tRNA(Asn)/Glu-tRNA(Gln) amidotransferase A subunit family amidase